jgi:hypothetical protein
MIGMKKIALVTAISAISASASAAEPEMLDDNTLKNIDGQAGISIDVETQWEIGEFAYRDAGYLLIQGFRLGGNSMGNGTGTAGDFLDNLRIEIDIAGDGSVPGNNELNYGFSAMRDIASIYNAVGNIDPRFADLENGTDTLRGGLAVDGKKTYGDGDLVMHFDFVDGWATEGGFDQYQATGRLVTDDYETVESMLEHAVDFRVEIDAVGLAASDYEVGSAGLDIDANHVTGAHEGAPGTTTLISQLSIQGYLGPEDLHIENRGNGFDGSGPLGAGTGNADSSINISRYFKITDMDYYLDIAGIQYKDIKIHNERGDLTGLDGTSSFNFAHSTTELFAVKDAVLQVDENNLSTLASHYRDGVALNTRFKGDIDIGHTSFGNDGRSVGEFYMTDFENENNMVISAH